MRHGSRAVAALIAAPVLLAATPAPGPQPTGPGGKVTLDVTGLRNTKGQVLACLTAKPKAFPDCSKDPAARTAVVAAGASVRIEFGHVPAGRYAISLIHDENGNRKMDMAIMMPKEGYGFSRNAPVSFGPPKFDKAAFDVSGDDVVQQAKMRYLL